MAVIVKDINMPSNCNDCEFCIKDYDYDEGFCSSMASFNEYPMQSSSPRLPAD